MAACASRRGTERRSRCGTQRRERSSLRWRARERPRREPRLMRRQLLKLLHVREFGPDAQFKEMCLGFTLPDVICRCGAGQVWKW